MIDKYIFMDVEGGLVNFHSDRFAVGHAAGSLVVGPTHDRERGLAAWFVSEVFRSLLMYEALFRAGCMVVDMEAENVGSRY